MLDHKAKLRHISIVHVCDAYEHATSTTEMVEGVASKKLTGQLADALNA
jgi:hypothetical protein